ncbi:hypothetical protein HLH34_11660 [Gluconacetobacter azotocaptans]|uniref:Uncharacterized protein n=1 Tax=Gluconacetobacter azotocaptans TaxID=142834 RepID=A0A7W4PH16_9PROT|nr:hypothetical protein [Gluconacetobacter azotocaptans]MBB2190606.1 hypothetical protein [Gluconacetobacter azotocaptans]GBQ30022.1 hypothetical protein AA13594_1574 [Gluconacetobacter azotocaptans DSM 13594]
MKLFIEKTPCCLVAPFEMPSILPSVLFRRIVPCDAEHPVRARERAQEREFEKIADVASILIAHLVPTFVVVTYPSEETRTMGVA